MGIQIERKEMTEESMMISNWKNPLVSMVCTIKFSALGLNVDGLGDKKLVEIDRFTLVFQYYTDMNTLFRGEWTFAIFIWTPKPPI